MTLTAMIREHNRLNGAMFSLLEFAAVAVGGLFFALAGVVNHHAWLTLAGFGVAVNAAAVAVLAGDALKNHEPGGSVRDFFRRAPRDKIQQATPNLGRHTLLICVATLLPFVLAAVVSIESRRNPS